MWYPVAPSGNGETLAHLIYCFLYIHSVLLITEQEIYSNFIDSIRATKTKQNYAAALKSYMAFYKFTKYSDLFNGQVYEQIKNFILDMKTRQLSSTTMNNAISALKLFYEMNDHDSIKWNKLRKFRGEESLVNEDRAYNHEEILKMLSFADLRLKATILLLSSTGMRIGAPSSLRIKHLERVDDLYRIRVYPGTREKYFSFCTPECAKALDEYFDFRARCGEKLEDDSPVFRTEFDADFVEAARKRVRVCSTTTLRKDIRRNLVKCGLRVIDRISPSGKNRKEVQETHGFRKFFKTQLILGRVDPDLRELLLGHSKKKLQLVYTRLSEEEIYQEYCKAIDVLTINPENRLKRELKTTQAKQDEIALMKLEHQMEMKEMNQRMDKMFSLIQENPKLAKVKKEVLSEI